MRQEALFINPDNDHQSSRIKQEMELLLIHFIVIYCKNSSSASLRFTQFTVQHLNIGFIIPLIIFVSSPEKEAWPRSIGES